MKIDYLFENIEKVFRYLVPAFVFTLLSAYFDLEIYKNHISKLDGTKLILYFFLGGMLIYSIHRIMFEIIDFIILKINNKSAFDIILASLKIEKEKLSSLYYKMATIHSVLITAELAIILNFYGNFRNHYYALLSSAICFLITLIIYWEYNKIQIKIIESLSQDINNRKLLLLF